MALTFKQARFCLEYFQCGNASSAALRAGYGADYAPQAGSALLQKIEVQKAIREHQEDAAYAATLTQARVLREMMLIAFANPTDLVRVTVTSCPACYPSEIRKQITDSGFAESLRVPRPGCEGCKGKGERDVWLADTASLSPAARKLFLGAKQGKDGIEVKLRDQTPILLALGKIVGLIKDKTELSGPGGGPVQIEGKSVKDWTTEELSEMLRKQITAGEPGV